MRYHNITKDDMLNGDGLRVVLWVAGIGVVVNFATALFFLRDKDRDLNVRGAYLHMAADALVSVGVMVSGAVMMATGWYLIDPLVGLLVAVILVAMYLPMFRLGGIMG